MHSIVYDPVGVGKVRFVGSSEIARSGKRPVAVKVGRSIAGKLMLDEVSQYKVETLLLPISQIGLCLFARQLGN